MTRNMTRTVLACLATATSLATVACGARGGEAPEAQATSADSGITIAENQVARIETDTIRRQRYTPLILSTGTVAFNGDRSTQVISPISGPVSRVMVNPGDSVVPGQVLAFVASPDFASALADYRKAETALKNAQRIATLDEKLFANDALARADLDQARADLSSAEADQDAALQQLKSLGVDDASINAIRDGKPSPGAVSAIRSPIAGTVVEKLITPGQLLAAGGSPAFTVADLSSVWVMGNVFGSDMSAVRRGTVVRITTDASPDTLQGTVDYVGALVDPDSKATPVRILVPNRGRVLRQNMLVSVIFHGARADEGVLVPVAAVLRDDDNLPFVYLATDKPTHFMRRRISLGGRTGEMYVVAGGLNPGDVVVTQGSLYLEAAGSQ